MKLYNLFLIVSIWSVLCSCNSPLEDENTTNNFVFKPVFTTKNKDESFKEKEADNIANEDSDIIEIFNEPVTVCDISIKLQKIDLPEIAAVKIIGEVIENNSTDENGGWEWILNSSVHGDLWVFDSSPNYAEIVIKKSDIDFLLDDNNTDNTLMFSFDFFSKECIGTDEFPVSPTLIIDNEKEDPSEFINL